MSLFARTHVNICAQDKEESIPSCKPLYNSISEKVARRRNYSISNQHAGIYTDNLYTMASLASAGCVSISFICNVMHIDADIDTATDTGG